MSGNRIPPLILIAGVGILLRMLWLDRESLWLDEFATWWCANGDLERALRAETNNPPLYYTLMHFWSGWFGPSETALRAFSAVASCGSLLVTYFFGRRVFSAPVALVAAGYMAILTFQLSYAQEARVHAFLSFLVLVATAVYLRILLESGRRWLWWGVYATLAAFCFYLHYISPIFYATHGLFTLWLVARRGKPFRLLVEHAGAGIAAALAFAPQIAYVMSGAGNINRSRDLIYLKLPQAYFSFLFGDYLLPLDQGAVQAIRATLKAYAPHLAGALICTLALAPFIWRAWRRWEGISARLSFAMAVVPVLLCFLLSFKVSVFDERYLLSVSPFLCLAVAAGVWEAWETRGAVRWLGLGAAGVWVALLLVALYHFYFDPRFHRERWREAVAALDERADPGRDQILMDPDYLHYPLMYYGRRNVPFDRLLEGRREALISAEPAYLEQLRKHRRLWLIRAHYQNDDLLAALRRSFAEQRYLHFDQGKRIEIYEFAPR